MPRPWRTLRGRLALLAAAAVALAVTIVCIAAYVLVRDNLQNAIDASLRAPAGATARPLPRLSARQLDNLVPRDLQFDVQRINAQGRILTSDGPADLPVTDADRLIAASGGSQITDRYDMRGLHVRVLTRSVANGAIMVARPLTETDRTLARLRVLLIIVAGGGVLGSAGLGLVVARAGIAPVNRLTEAAERIARTENPDPPVPEAGSDELARLGRAFNAMVTALASSRDRQRNLVLDASHELRTPVTVLQTNIELLERAENHPERLPADQRHTLLADLNAQAWELGDLINDLVELARADGRAVELRPLDLADTVEAAVERVRLRAPGVIFDIDLETTPLSGDASTLERAVVNLLDNAVKFGPPRQTVTVTLKDHELAVADQGPGIAEEDLPHVFDRFYRATTSRQLPGSGLGLAIVAQAVDLHGGDISIHRAAGGGAAVRLAFT